MRVECLFLGQGRIAGESSTLAVYIRVQGVASANIKLLRPVLNFPAAPKRRYLGGDDMKVGPMDDKKAPMDDKKAPPQVGGHAILISCIYSGQSCLELLGMHAACWCSLGKATCKSRIGRMPLTHCKADCTLTCIVPSYSNICAKPFRL